MSSDATTQSLRAELERERDELRQRLAELGFGDGGAGLDYDQNFADSSQVTAERGEAEAVAKSLQETLTDVEHALAKLESGEYGICENCGQPIPPERLSALPYATTCLKCAGRARSR